MERVTIGDIALAAIDLVHEAERGHDVRGMGNKLAALVRQWDKQCAPEHCGDEPRRTEVAR